MVSHSYWQDSFPSSSFPSLAKDSTTDVAVVGGGMTGLSAAYLIAASGKRVIVLERDRCAQMDTAHTTAHLTYVTDRRISNLVKEVGAEDAYLLWEAGRAAINQIEQIVEREQIQCDFRRVPGYLTGSLERAYGEDTSALRSDAELAAKGEFGGAFVERAPIFNHEAVQFPQQACFHPLRYLAGIQNKLVAMPHAEVFEHTKVESIEGSGAVVELRCQGGHTVRASKVIVCTHVPIMGKTPFVKATFFQTKLAPYTSYVVSGRVGAGEVDDVLLWDVTDPYYYLRVAKGEECDEVIFGGLDHKTGQSRDPELHFRLLATLLKRMIPQVEISSRWSGQVIETPDGLPYIGEIAENQFLITGYSGNGITLGTTGGMMAREYVHGRSTPWRDLFSPMRLTPSGVGEQIRENSDYPYYLVHDRIRGGEDIAPEALGYGQGAVIEIGGKRYAVHREEDGTLAACSPSCTHMGCYVHWNSAEESWDCPCHGSRFSPTGEVLAGPAEKALEKMELPPDLHGSSHSGPQRKRRENRERGACVQAARVSFRGAGQGTGARREKRTGPTGRIPDAKHLSLGRILRNKNRSSAGSGSLLARLLPVYVDQPTPE